MVGYTTKRFRSYKYANAAAKSFKEDYGYRPSIFQEDGKDYVIVKPKGIKKLI